MNKISDLISMPVITLYEGNHAGIVYNLFFDRQQKKCKYLSILNESDNLIRLIKPDDIYKIGKSCIFIKNENCLDLECNNDKELNKYTNPINMKIYNLNGEQLGFCLDALLNNNLQIQEITLNNGKVINNNEIFNLGKNIILTHEKNISISKFKPKSKVIKTSQNDNNKVVILKEEMPAITIVPKEQNTKIITDYRFLVGRVIEKDITALNGETIAKTGSIITKDIVNKASLYGKLIEISRHSKKRHI